MSASLPPHVWRSGPTRGVAVFHPPPTPGHGGRHVAHVSGGRSQFGRYWVGVFGLLALTAVGPGLPPQRLFLSLTTLLAAYLLLEILAERRANPGRWLLSPAVAASIATFFLGCVIPAFTFFSTSYSQAVALSYLDGNRAFEWLSLAAGCAMLAALGLWMGYRRSSAARAGLWVRDSSFLGRWLRHSYDLRLPAIFSLVAAAIGARAAQAALGVFGYSAEQEQLLAQAAVTQVLSLTAGMTRVALLALAVTYFSGVRKGLEIKLALGVTFASEIIFSGLLAGFKGGVFFPVVAVATCYYWFRSKISTWLVLLGIVLLIFAYAVVEPFRILRNEDPNFNTRSLKSIATAVNTIVDNLGAGTSSVADPNAPVSSFLTRVADRNNILVFAAIGIKYKQEHEVLPPESPKFLRDVLLSPALAVTPRFLWQDKPISNLGQWFNREVLGYYAATTSVAMSPFGYLYFAGGVIAIFVGFFAAGFCQRIVWESLRTSGGGVVILMGLLPSLAMIDSAFYSFFSANLQLLFLLLIVQRFVFKR
jgi:hypothetical protein